MAEVEELLYFADHALDGMGAIVAELGTPQDHQMTQDTALLPLLEELYQHLGQMELSAIPRGVCHSDSFFVDAAVPGVRFPLVPRHEIAGRIEELGEGVHTGWQVGDRVAVGWFGAAATTARPADRATSSCVTT